MRYESIHLILFFVVSVVLIWVMIEVLILTIKHYKKNIKEKEKKEREFQEKLHQSSIEKKKIKTTQYFREQNLQKEVSEMQKKLSHYEQEIELKEQILNKIHVNDDKQTIVNTLRETKLITPQDWVGFRSSFEIIYPNFIKKVLDLHPQITSQETKVLVLSCLNFSYSEQAFVLGVSEQAVRRVWYRFRSKNNIDKNSSLTEYVEYIKVDE